MKRLVVAVTAIIVVVALMAALGFYFSETLPATLNTEPITPHYLSYNGGASKIFLAGAASSYGNSNETLTTSNGIVVQKGSPLFIVTATLRNDYTSDEPAPVLPNQGQTSPADGTAYLYLTAQVYAKDGTVNTTDVSASAFALPATSGTGLVLASGETVVVNICLSTSRTDINRCDVNLIFLGDSIPT
jgi:hypothetical protein